MTATKVAETNNSNSNSSNVAVLIGTMKGLFIARSSNYRSDWTLDGPHFAGQSVYAAMCDDRAGRSRLWAAIRSMHWGAQLCSSDDLWKAYPGLRDRVVTEQGRVRPHVIVFIGTDDIRNLDRLETAVSDASEISILPAVSGG